MQESAFRIQVGLDARRLSSVGSAVPAATATPGSKLITGSCCLLALLHGLILLLLGAAWCLAAFAWAFAAFSSCAYCCRCFFISDFDIEREFVSVAVVVVVVWVVCEVLVAAEPANLGTPVDGHTEDGGIKRRAGNFGQLTVGPAA